MGQGLYVDKQGGGGISQLPTIYYISLCCKLVTKGGHGVKNPQNIVNVVYECPKRLLIFRFCLLFILKFFIVANVCTLFHFTTLHILFLDLLLGSCSFVVEIAKQYTVSKI